MPKIAAIQMCSSNAVDENLESASKLIEEAASNGTKLILLPEMFPIIGNKATDKIEIKEEYGSGKIQTFLSEQASKFNIWIVGGTIPISCKDDAHKIKAACLVYDNKGKVVARYDKIHLFDVVISESESYKESDTTQPGDELTVIDTPVGKLGLSVCYDIRFPALFTHLARLGAEIIAIPSAFTMKTGEAHWRLLARSRAVENFCYVIGACQGGTHTNGRKTYGHSLIIGPWGDVIQETNEPGNAIIYSNINLEKLHKIRSSIPIMKHHRIKTDLSSLENKTS